MTSTRGASTLAGMAQDTERDAGDVKRWEAVEEAAELLQEGRYHDALTALRDVIRADAMNAYAYHLTGSAFFELSKLDAARDAYRAAVRVSPRYLGARVALSNVLRALGDTRGAIAQAKIALQHFPNDGDARHALGLAQAAQGERAAAKKNLEGFLASGPELEAATEVRQILEMLGLGEEGDPLDIV